MRLGEIVSALRRALVVLMAIALAVPSAPVVVAAPVSAVAPVRPSAAAAALPSNPVDYSYDASGQLKGVSQSGTGGATGRYNYDGAGNLTSVDRYASTVVSVVSVVPARASVGATVTISGTGFAATPAGNTVSFNGKAATVSAA
jgi:YD repeat-containing protein